MRCCESEPQIKRAQLALFCSLVCLPAQWRHTKGALRDDEILINADSLTQPLAGIAQLVKRLTTSWMIRGSRFSVSVQIGPAATFLQYDGYRVCSWGQSCQGVALITHPDLASRLKKGQSYISASPMGLYGLLQGEIYLYFLPVQPNQMQVYSSSYILSLSDRHRKKKCSNIHLLQTYQFYNVLELFLSDHVPPQPGFHDCCRPIGQMSHVGAGVSSQLVVCSGALHQESKENKANYVNLTAPDTN